jgi:hypothetical protein
MNIQNQEQDEYDKEFYLLLLGKLSNLIKLTKKL